MKNECRKVAEMSLFIGVNQMTMDFLKSCVWQYMKSRIYKKSLLFLVSTLKGFTLCSALIKRQICKIQISILKCSISKEFYTIADNFPFLSMMFEV